VATGMASVSSGKLDGKPTQRVFVLRLTIYLTCFFFLFVFPIVVLNSDDGTADDEFGMELDCPGHCRITNVMGLVDLGTKVDLNYLGTHLWNVEYQPKVSVHA
jgi:hypothetical protein